MYLQLSTSHILAKKFLVNFRSQRCFLFVPKLCCLVYKPTKLQMGWRKIYIFKFDFYSLKLSPTIRGSDSLNVAWSLYLFYGKLPVVQSSYCALPTCPVYAALLSRMRIQKWPAFLQSSSETWTLCLAILLLAWYFSARDRGLRDLLSWTRYHCR